MGFEREFPKEIKLFLERGVEIQKIIPIFATANKREEVVQTYC